TMPASCGTSTRNLAMAAPPFERRHCAARTRRVPYPGHRRSLPGVRFGRRRGGSRPAASMTSYEDGRHATNATMAALERRAEFRVRPRGEVSMRKSPLVLLLLTAVSLPTALFADEVIIKGAGSISGRIVDQTATSVVVDVGGGTIGIPMARVERIVKA